MLVEIKNTINGNILKFFWPVFSVSSNSTDICLTAFHHNLPGKIPKHMIDACYHVKKTIDYL